VHEEQQDRRRSLSTTVLRATEEHRPDDGERESSDIDPATADGEAPDIDPTAE
jgi:hypothetical protein